MALLLIAPALIFGAAWPVRAAGSEHSKAFWRGQIRKVHLRMRQHRVLELLPNRSEETKKFDKEWEPQTATLG